MKFELSLQVELPFVLNLPSQAFNVALPSGSNMTIEVDNDMVMVQMQNRTSIHGRRANLAALLKVPEADLPAEKMRTVLSHYLEEDAIEADLPAVDDPTLVDCLTRQHLDPTLTPEQLRKRSEDAFSQMSSQDRDALRLRERQRVFGQILVRGLTGSFLLAINRLIRWYTIDCEDFFVEEVSFHQLAGTRLLGVLHRIVVDGAQLECIPLVGKAPPIFPKPWRTHSPATITALEAHIGSMDDPDFAKVLVRRAQHLLERSAFRSAIAEAAASLEVAVARAIRKAMVGAGHSSQAVDVELAKTKMNFPQRAELTLKHWCTVGVKELDLTLWTQLLLDRTAFRNAVVHSDREPNEAEARDVVDRFTKMTGEVLAKC